MGVMATAAASGTSRAFYRRGVEPRRLFRLAPRLQGDPSQEDPPEGRTRQRPGRTTATIRSRRSVEVWTTTCIVTNFGRDRSSKCNVLINPSNPQLSGTRNFPYFPRGGPVPSPRGDSAPSVGELTKTHKDWQPLGYVSSWGGMEVGTGMVYPVGVVDGLVHLMGGAGLQLECGWERLKWKVATATATMAGKLRHGDGGDSSNAQDVQDLGPCPVGSAVATSSGTGPLRLEYDRIVHTTPPFYLHHADPIERLRNCYASALSVAASAAAESPPPTLRIAAPLLGAGARGFPADVAVAVAARAAVGWCHRDDDGDGGDCKESSDDDDNNEDESGVTVPSGRVGTDGADDRDRAGRREVSLVFGILEESVGEELVMAIRREEEDLLRKRKSNQQGGTGGRLSSIP